MKQTIDNQQGRQSRSKDAANSILEKLEVLWDKQVMRGDDESVEDMDLCKSDQSTKHEDAPKEARRISKRRVQRI